MFEAVKKWFGLKKNKQEKRIAWNEGFELCAGNGTYILEGFTGHISFDERTECDVENATLTFIVGNVGYLDGSASYHAPWSRGVNRILWKDGIVTGGNLCCFEFEQGRFNGEKLLIVKDSMRGEFNGKELHENLPY